MKVPTGQRASQRKTNGPFDEHFDISVPSKRRRDSNGTNEIKSEVRLFFILILFYYFYTNIYD